jgi:hypothetical protein
LRKTPGTESKKFKTKRERERERRDKHTHTLTDTHNKERERERKREERRRNEKKLQIWELKLPSLLSLCSSPPEQKTRKKALPFPFSLDFLVLLILACFAFLL